MPIHSHLPFNQPELSRHATGQHTHYRTCTLCEAMCGIEIKTEGLQIVSIRGDERDPFSRGHICPKAVALKDLHEDPERIRHPLRRTPDGWERISWDDALKTVTSQLKRIQKQYGRDAVATYLGNPNAHNMGTLLFGLMFLKGLRTKNKFSATSVDQLPHHIVSYQLFGHYLYIPVPDLDHTDYFLMIGGNPLASNGSLMTAPDVKARLKAVQARGGQVVVIDPRRSETAEIASQHHFIRPATDALLLLGMLHVLHREGWVRPNHVAAFTPAWDQVGHFVAPYPPERVSELTGISVETIERLTHEFAHAKRAVCYGRMGASVQAFGTLTQYLIMLLNILTGRLDQRGGLMFPTPAVNVLGKSGRGHIGKYRSRVRGLPEFTGELPVACLAEEILTEGDGQIKALIVAAGNPVLSTPNGAQLDRALEELEFMVSVDFYINETNRHADIILPPVGPLERDHYDIVFHNFAIRDTAKWSNALFPPQGEARQDWQIYIDLALRMQIKSPLLRKLGNFTLRELGPAALIDGLLRSGEYGLHNRGLKGLSLAKLKANPQGIDLGALKSHLPAKLWHKDKQIHLAFDYFMTDLSRLEQHFFGKQAQAHRQDYPLQLIGRRHVRSNNSWLHNSQRLVKGKPRCTLIIHPQDAAAYGITHGEWVEIGSRVGSVRAQAEVSDQIMQGVVSLPHGWGHHRAGTRWSIAEQHAGVSMNDLTDELLLDELSGNAVLNGIPVQLRAVTPEAAV